MQRESLVARTYKYIDLNSVYLNQFLLRNNKYMQNYVCPITIENVLFLYIFFINYVFSQRCLIDLHHNQMNFNLVPGSLQSFL